MNKEKTILFLHCVLFLWAFAELLCIFVLDSFIDVSSIVSVLAFGNIAIFLFSGPFSIYSIVQKVKGHMDKKFGNPIFALSILNLAVVLFAYYFAVMLMIKYWHG